MKSQLQTIGVSLLSAVVGALMVAWYQTPKVGPKIPVAALPSAASAPVEVRVVSAGTDPELARRLSAVEQQLANRNEPKPNPIEELPTDPAEAAARALEDAEAQENSFAREPVDRAWAAAAAQSFQADLASFEGSTFKAGPVDCRTRVCRTKLTWASYDAARSEAKSVVQHGYATNCTKEVFTPPPDGDRDAPYTASLYFDCSNLRRKAN